MAAAVLAGSSAALLGAVGLAQAVWTSSGEGTPAAVVATLTSPTVTKATPGAGVVELEWSASTAPGPGTVQYYVTGEGGTPGSGCPTAGAPSAVRSCTLSGVSIGSHHYTVTAVWRSWTSSSEARSVTVSFGAATHLLVEAANAEVNAGEADDLTVIAKDAANNTVLTYSGSHSLTFSGAASAPNGTSPTVTSESGTATGLGTATAIKFNEGKATVEGSKNGLLTLYRVEEAHIKVTEGELSNEGALVAVKVKPGPFKSFHVVATPAEPEAGQSFEAKITAWDEWHNVLTAYARTAGKKLLYSGAASSPSGTAPVYSATTEPTFTAGETTVTGFKFYDATTNTLKVEEETSANRGEASVKVKSVSGAAATKHWAWVHAEVTAGSITSPTCLFTCTATGVTVFNRFKARIAITDEWGNVASNVAGTNRAQVTLTGLGLLQNGAGIAIPTSGPAESTTTVELESLLFFGEGNLRVTTEAGLALTEATATVGF
jgi:hypothetical protein